MAARGGAGQRNSPARSPFRRAKPQGASMHVVGARHEGSGLELVVPDAMPAAKARTDAVVAGVRPAQRRGPGGPRAKAPGDGNRERLRREDVVSNASNLVTLPRSARETPLAGGSEPGTRRSAVRGGTAAPE